MLPFLVRRAATPVVVALICAGTTACGTRFHGEQADIVNTVRSATSLTNPNLCHEYTQTIAYIDSADGKTKRIACARASFLPIIEAVNVLSAQVTGNTATVVVFSGRGSNYVFSLERLRTGWRVRSLLGVAYIG